MIAGAYLGVSVVWILGSGHVARALAPTMEALAQIERVKGLAFVLASAIGLFVLSWMLFRRLLAQHQRAQDTLDALVTAERRALAGTLAAAVAHDANNLITVMLGLNELLLADPRLQERSRVRAEEMRRAIDRLTSLVGRMRRIGGNGGHRDARDVNLVELVQDCVVLMRSHMRVKHVALQVKDEGAPHVSGDPLALHNAVANLVLNAAEATDGKGVVEVRLLPFESGALVEVHDDGPGLSPELRARVLEGFYTTKPEGTGLGLLSVLACAEAHGGRLEIDTSPLGGACFRLFVRPTPT